MYRQKHLKKLTKRKEKDDLTHHTTTTTTFEYIRIYIMNMLSSSVD